jgi:ribosomal subunit interface protein|tara:strand:+ start:1139 stop:1726 length:588 start_codon:yes stop_codon:yes gene_type:complete
MIFNLSGKQIQLSQTFSTYAKFETEKCIFKYFNNPISSILNLSKINRTFYINIVVHLNNKMNFLSLSDGETPIIALENSLYKLSKQLRRYKRKIKNHSRDKSINKYNTLNLNVDSFKFTDQFDNSNEKTPLIFAEIVNDIEILTVSQAVKKLSSDLKPALMFRNINHSGLNMIYKRNDGMIGWVDPRGLRSTLQI